MRTPLLVSRWASALVVSALVALTGCIDLGAIRRMTAQVPSAADYSGLVTYYVQHFEHQKRYRPASEQANLNQQAEKRLQQEQALLALYRGVTAYLDAVGSLASDEIVNYDQSLGNLADEVKSSGIITDARADAYSSLAAFVAKAATDGYRRRKLKQLITEANAPFQKVMAGLTNIVGRDFVRSLDVESDEADSFYQDIVAAASRGGGQEASVALVKERWRARIEDLKARREACATFSAAITTIARAHQDMYERREQLASAETLQTIFTYEQELAALRARFKQNQP